jgi:hypothetical protein
MFCGEHHAMPMHCFPFIHSIAQNFKRKGQVDVGPTIGTMWNKIRDRDQQGRSISPIT